MATIVLDQQIRNGTFGTGSIAPTLGAVRLVVDSTMSDADAQNPASSLLIVAYASFDMGQTYAAFGAPYHWQGGLSPRDGSFTRPMETVALPTGGSGQLPDLVRVSIDTLGNSLNVGMTLDTN